MKAWSTIFVFVLKTSSNQNTVVIVIGVLIGCFLEYENQYSCLKQSPGDSKSRHWLLNTLINLSTDISRTMNRSFHFSLVVTPPLIIEVPVPIDRNMSGHVCVLRVSILSMYLRFFYWVLYLFLLTVIAFLFFLLNPFCFRCFFFHKTNLM